MKLPRRTMLKAGAVSGATMLGLTPWPAAAALADLPAAINRAGRQRMLSQRIAKLYLCLAQGVESQRSQGWLDLSVAAFDRALVELKVFAPTEPIKATYRQLELQWLGVKDIVVGTRAAEASARALLDLEGELLATAHQGTLQLQGAAGAKPASEWVNLAGRQRMLSQQMAKLFLALRSQRPPEAGQQAIQRAREEYIQAAERLGRAAAGWPEVASQLDMAAAQWTFFDAALGARQQGASRERHALDVLTASERMLEVLDKATEGFERRAR